MLKGRRERDQASGPAFNLSSSCVLCVTSGKPFDLSGPSFSDLQMKRTGCNGMSWSLTQEPV